MWCAMRGDLWRAMRGEVPTTVVLAGLSIIGSLIRRSN